MAADEFRGSGELGADKHAEAVSEVLQLWSRLAALERDDELIEARARDHAAQLVLRAAVALSAEDQQWARSVQLAQAAFQLAPTSLGLTFEEGCAVLKKTDTYRNRSEEEIRRHAVTQEINAMLEEVLQFWNEHSGHVAETGESLEAAVSTMLAETMELELKAAKITVERKRKELMLVSLQCDVAAEMAQLIHQEAFAVRPESERANALWLGETSKTMASKLRAFRADLMSQTYTKETVGSLRRARADLERAQVATEREYEEAQSSCRQYREVASLGFHDIAKEYAAVRDHLRHLRWTLSELADRNGGGAG